MEMHLLRYTDILVRKKRPPILIAKKQRVHG
jgi:hypothetical protein